MLLTIDLGTLTGITYGDPKDGLPRVDLWRLPQTGDDHGAFGKAFVEKLTGFISLHPTQYIGYEKPMAVRAVKRGPVWSINTNLTTLRKLYGLAFTVELVASQLGIPCFEVNIAAGKKALTGKGNAKKEDMVAAAVALGLTWPVNARLSEREHIADALGVWLTMARQLDQDAAKNFEPLFNQPGKTSK